MRRALLLLTAILLAGAPAWPQGASGPIKARPRPSTAPKERLPPPPRIGARPPEFDRNPAAYIPPTDPVLLRAIDANEEFGEKLPNFLCRQRMTRSSSRNLGQKWKEDDVIEAEVLMLEDREEYRDITVDGRPTGAKELSQVGGAWSTGEYGTVMWNLFIPPSHTQFTAAGSDTVGERKTLVYKYEIEQKNSRWRLNVNSKSYSPGHFGRVWIDVETGRGVRMETEATFLPYDFPLSSAKGSVEYADVDIDGQSYLLPTVAENIVCVRDSARCSKINIEFRDYKKFSAESNIFTSESEIDFGQPVPEDPTPTEEPK